MVLCALSNETNSFIDRCAHGRRYGAGSARTIAPLESKRTPSRAVVPRRSARRSRRVQRSRGAVGTLQGDLDSTHLRSVRRDDRQREPGTASLTGRTSRSYVEAGDRQAPIDHTRQTFSVPEPAAVWGSRSGIRSVRFVPRDIM